MPGGACPPVGPVGLGSPPSSVLCSAQTAPLPISGRFARRSLPDTAPASVRSWCPWWAHEQVEAPDHARACGRPVPSSGRVVTEREGSPTFPSSPSEALPRSQTPVGSCALACIAPRMVAFRCLHPGGGCLETAEAILLTPTLPIAGLNHAPCLLAHSSFVRPWLGWHVECPTDLLARR